MKKPTLISVIVCTYNQEDTIGRTLDSILCQQCHLPIEIVVGEDGSTDGTRAVCQDYAERYPGKIRLMAGTRNKGVVDNYFDCLLICRGELIADCAGDDYWTDPLKLEKESRIMEADDSVTIVHTAWSTSGGDVKQSPFPAPLTDGGEMLEAILTQTDMPVIHLCTSLYRAETILSAYHEQTQFFRSHQWGCEDLQTAFFLAKAGRVAYIPDITLCYSISGNTISSPREERRRFGFYKGVTELSYKLSETYDISSPLMSRFFHQRVIALLMHAFRCFDHELRAEAISCQQRWGVSGSVRLRILRTLTSNDFCWRATLRLRRLIVSAKQWLR